RLGEQAADVRLLGHVGLDGDRPAALARDRRDDAVGAFLAGGVVDDHGRPLVGQLFGDGGADPLGRARDDGDFAGQLLCVRGHGGLLWKGFSDHRASIVLPGNTAAGDTPYTAARDFVSAGSARRTWPNIRDP